MPGAQGGGWRVAMGEGWRRGKEWELLSSQAVMVTKGMWVTFLFREIKIFLDGTLHTCLCY